MVTNAKFEIEKFAGTTNFAMWQYKIINVLFQQNSQMVLEKDEPEDIT